MVFRSASSPVSWRWICAPAELGEGRRTDSGTASLVLLFDQAPEQIEELLSEPVV